MLVVLWKLSTILTLHIPTRVLHSNEEKVQAISKLLKILQLASLMHQSGYNNKTTQYMQNRAVWFVYMYAKKSRGERSGDAVG